MNYRLLVVGVSKRVVQLLGSAKNWHTHAMHLCKKFLLLMRYNLFMGVNVMRVKNITVTVSVRVSVTG